MRTKIIYHKHLTRNVYLFIYFTCFHLFIFYISWNQTNVVYFFRRISLFFILHRHFISLSSHPVVISSRCHLISLSSHLVVILHHFRKINSSNFVLVNVSNKKTTNLKNFSQDDTSTSQSNINQSSISWKRQKSINQKSD